MFYDLYSGWPHFRLPAICQNVYLGRVILLTLPVPPLGPVGFQVDDKAPDLVKAALYKVMRPYMVQIPRTPLNPEMVNLFFSFVELCNLCASSPNHAHNPLTPISSSNRQNYVRGWTVIQNPRPSTRRYQPSETPMPQILRRLLLAQHMRREYAAFCILPHM